MFVTYKEQVIIIPICIWLSICHPYSLPIVYVTPSKSMQIEVSHLVDLTGCIHIQYLNEWQYPLSCLSGLVYACREAFGELPPVFFKSNPISSHTLEDGNDKDSNIIFLIYTNDDFFFISKTWFLLYC